jgi:hypothetical protein
MVQNIIFLSVILFAVVSCGENADIVSVGDAQTHDAQTIEIVDGFSPVDVGGDAITSNGDAMTDAMIPDSDR